MKVNGSTINVKAMESMFIVMELNIKEVGEMTSNMEKVLKVGLMVLFILVNILKAKNMAMEISNGMIIVSILDNSITIILKVMESTNGQMVGLIKENGLTTRCLEKVYSNGQIIESISGSSKMIKGMGSVFMSGQTIESIMDNGSMVNSKAKESLYLIMNKKDLVNGKMVIEKDGSFSASRKTRSILIQNCRSTLE